MVDNTSHSLKINHITNTSINLTFYSESINVILELNESKEIPDSNFFNI